MARTPSPALPEQMRALALAALLSVLFLGGSLLPGRVLLPFSPVCFSPWYEAASPAQRKAAVDQAVPHLADKWLQYLPFAGVTGERWRELDPPVWTTRLLGGHMFAGDVVPQPFHPLQVLASLAGPAGTMALVFFVMQVATGLFLFRFLRVMGLPELASHLGLVSWTVGLWVQARVHHPMVLTAAFTLPLALEAVERIARQRQANRGRARWVGVLALAVGSCWLGGFTQAAVQCTVLAGAFALYRLPAGVPGARPAAALRGLFLVAAGIGAGCLLGAVQTLPALEAAELSVRGRETALEQRAVALQPAHLVAAVLPTAMHPVREFTLDRVEETRPSFLDLLLLDTSKGQRFNHTETAFYAGLAPLLLALGALFRRRLAGAMFFSVALVGSLLLAFGVWPVLDLAHSVPGLGIGDPKRFLLTASFSLAVLGAIGFARALRGELPRFVPLAAGSMGLLGSGVTVLLALVSDERIAGWFADALGARYAQPPEQFLAAAGSTGQIAYDAAGLRRSFLLLAGAALLVFPCVRRGRAPYGVVGVLLLAVTAAELLLHGHGRCLAIDRREVLTTPAILRPVVEDEAFGRFQRIESRPRGGPMRSPRVVPPNLPSLLGIDDAGGYTVFTTRRLDELWNAVEPGTAQGGAVGAFGSDAALRSPVLDAYGVRWILADREITAPGVTDATPPSAAAGPYRLYRRDRALPRAYLVHGTRLLPDRERRLRFLGSESFRPATEVVLEDIDSPGLRDREASGDRIEITVADHEQVLVRTASGNDAYLVLADPWYPGWRVTVDGSESRLFVANHALRAVRLPAGPHEVLFRFESQRFALGSTLSGIAAAFAAGCLLLGSFRRPR